MKDLTVEIPRKYKKALVERFSLKNAKRTKWGTWEIKKPCLLCNEYHSKCLEIRCRKCPFFIFKSVCGVGCLNWINDLIDTFYVDIVINKIYWDDEDDKQARKQLKLLKKKAKELIKWV